MIKAEILLDSIGAGGSAPRLTTFLLTFPRFILSEVNTHRMLSRNYPSSRAIPVEKRLEMMSENLVIPIEWGMNDTSMQSKVVASSATAHFAELEWRKAAFHAMQSARELNQLGLHKQIVNRLLEPFIEVTGLVTGTQAAWENFLALRAEESADPHIQRLAYLLLEEYNRSTPQILKPGEWHVPFGSQMPPGLSWDEQIKVAVARSARVSFNNFDGSQDVEKDFKLHDRLAAQGHWSSFEHIAQVPSLYHESSETVSLATAAEKAQALGGNLAGWLQLRKTYPHECRRDARVVHKP